MDVKKGREDKEYMEEKKEKGKVGKDEGETERERGGHLE
jgi:hypothetical protein